MKKELQKIIIVMKQKEEKAMQDVDRYEDVPHMQGIAIGKSQAFSSCIQWLTLLLNSESENSGKNDADNSDKPM